MCCHRSRAHLLWRVRIHVPWVRLQGAPLCSGGPPLARLRPQPGLVPPASPCPFCLSPPRWRTSLTCPRTTTCRCWRPAASATRTSFGGCSRQGGAAAGEGGPRGGGGGPRGPPAGGGCCCPLVCVVVHVDVVGGRENAGQQAAGQHRGRLRKDATKTRCSHSAAQESPRRQALRSACRSLARLLQAAPALTLYAAQTPPRRARSFSPVRAPLTRPRPHPLCRSSALPSTTPTCCWRRASRRVRRARS